MLNPRHAELLGLIIPGAQDLGGLLSQDRGMATIQQANSRALDFCHLVPDEKGNAIPPTPRDLELLSHFLIDEFAYKHDDRAPDRRIGIPTIQDKLEGWPHRASRRGQRPFQRAYSRWLDIWKQCIGRPLDALFVTALPHEYQAVLRHIDYYLRGTVPGRTRGRNGREARTGWVSGASRLEGRRLLHAACVCAARYGPSAAAAATSSLVREFQPRAVIVVGVAASLGDTTTFDLGDVGFSSVVEDITLGKEETESNLEVVVSASSGPDGWDRVPESWREQLEGVLTYENGLLKLRGVLSEESRGMVSELFDSANDRAAIETLAAASRERAEALNLQANVWPRPCDTSFVSAAASVAAEGRWRERVHLPKPNGDGGIARAIEVQALSGSSVVKQFGMRDYLRATFPGRLLLEMEGAGVGQACEENGLQNPMVVKAACDWATPAKEKSWQPYCAEAAAAFAFELACNLRRNDR